MCRKNCKWDVWGGQSIHLGGNRPSSPSQCSYVPVPTAIGLSYIMRCTDQTKFGDEPVVAFGCDWGGCGRWRNAIYGNNAQTFWTRLVRIGNHVHDGTGSIWCRRTVVMHQFHVNGWNITQTICYCAPLINQSINSGLYKWEYYKVY